MGILSYIPVTRPACEPTWMTMSLRLRASLANQLPRTLRKNSKTLISMSPVLIHTFYSYTPSPHCLGSLAGVVVLLVVTAECQYRYVMECWSHIPCCLFLRVQCSMSSSQTTSFLLRPQFTMFTQAAIYDVCSGCFRYSKTAIIKNPSYQSLPAAYAGLVPIIFHNSFATHGPQTATFDQLVQGNRVAGEVVLGQHFGLQNTHKQMQTHL